MSYALRRNSGGLAGVCRVEGVSAVTNIPFSDDAIPVQLTDEERAMDALKWMHTHYGTTLFDN